ncbi:zinc finger protein 148-like isoform X2 [Heptranchias perlo]|uniref:zinc finger protein 148-like isoform X2 n=1 Tax=Heptranchias perlo TaxID=212740 RepID=UPI00355AB51F
MSRVDGISDHPSVPLGGQQPLLEYRRAPQPAPLVDNAMLQDNTSEVGILQDSSVSHEMVGSHSLLQSRTISHEGMITDSDPMTRNTMRSADGVDSRVAVTVTQGLPCAPQVLGKSRVLEGAEQLDGKKQREHEDQEKLRENENLMKLRENEELLKLRQHEELLKLRQHEELMKLREHEELMKKQKSKKIRTTSKILVVGEDGSFMVKSPKTHICEQCSAAFRTNYHLQRHILIHTGEKPFHCDECDMRFIQKYHMERHKRTHSGEKPYQCEYCLQYFSRTDRLLKHRRMCHENQGKVPGKNSAVKTEPIILAINAENRFLSPPKDIINPRKKLKTAEKPALGTSNKEETGNPAEVKVDKGDCVEYYTSNLKVKDEYKVEQCSLVIAHSSHSNDHLGDAYQNQMNLHPPKLVLKKVSSKKNQKTVEQLNQTVPVSANFDATKVNKYTYAMVDNPDLLVIEGQSADQGQDASRKPGGSSSNSNYDDAMQFVKKKRFLQGTTSTSREYALTVGQISTQPAVTQAATTTVGENSSGTSMLVQPSNTELKSSQDKSGIPDEVLQTLLDHYTNKANGQVPFSVSDTQVASNITVSSTDITNVPPSERVNESSQPVATDNCNMLHEYSKFLQQALERTCHNDSYSAEQGLAYETETHALTGSLQVQPLFSSLERQVFATMVTQHGFRPEMGSSLRLPSQKSQYSLLVGESQHPFAFIPTVTSSNSISSPPDFIEQVNSQKKREEPPAHHNHQMDTFGQDSRFSATGGEMTPSFNDSTSGQVNLRVRQGSSDFSEFSLVNVPEGRDQMSASPDATGGQAFR